MWYHAFMAGELRTRASLLLRIRNFNDADAWKQFVAVYEPVISGYLRRRGLREADAADVAQETLQAIARSIDRFVYDPSKGHFRGWLLTIARRQLGQLLEARSKAVVPVGSGQTIIHEMLNEHPDEQEAQQWDRDCEQQALRWAMDQVRHEFEPRTWQAFYATAVELTAPQDVAKQLDMNVGSVYTARSRVTARLREVIEEFDLA
jgi:RNA polymerase sigma-70 factor (ECF subfamily)